LSYGLLYILNGSKLELAGRIEQVKDIHNLEQDKEKNKSFNDRAIKPIYDAFTGTMLRLTPQHKVEALGKRLEKAGLLKTALRKDGCILRACCC
jgi:hypothetical protein